MEYRRDRRPLKLHELIDERPLKLHELIDELEKAVVEVSEQKLPTSIIIFPPDNANGEITDEDSGEEDFHQIMPTGKLLMKILERKMTYV
ncbi:hypothetical protein QE152_g7367 [Popillia japonica]|uniref:Uncharacterized protein n=1 Tax=Popillia japonica TaxID=7064 RepID=A0AAW1MF00_POPJA